MSTTNIPRAELKVDDLLEAMERMPVCLNPFEILLKREGFDPERDEVLLIVPPAWLGTELEPWLRQPRKWLKLSPLVDQVYLMDVGRVKQELANKPFNFEMMKP